MRWWLSESRLGSAPGKRVPGGSSWTRYTPCVDAARVKTEYPTNGCEQSKGEKGENDDEQKHRQRSRIRRIESRAKARERPATLRKREDRRGETNGDDSLQWVEWKMTARKRMGGVRANAAAGRSSGKGGRSHQRDPPERATRLSNVSLCYSTIGIFFALPGLLLSLKED